MSELLWKRPRTQSTEIAKHTIYDSKCGLYRVVHWEPLLSGEKSEWQAWLLMKSGRLLNTHRTRAAAERTCEAHNRT